MSSCYVTGKSIFTPHFLGDNLWNTIGTNMARSLVIGFYRSRDFGLASTWPFFSHDGVSLA